MISPISPVDSLNRARFTQAPKPTAWVPGAGSVGLSAQPRMAAAFMTIPVQPYQPTQTSTQTVSSVQTVPQATPPFKLDGIRVGDRELIAALYVLSQTENLPRDEAYLKSIGVNIQFHNGRQAIDVLRRRGVSIIFSDMGDSTAHAEWIADMDLIKINKRYKGDFSLPTLYALSEAIYHEAGHAAHRGDDRSSIQEDVDCLALNALAYRAHAASTPAYPYYHPRGTLKPLFDNGVARYAQLYFNWDPYSPPSFQGSDPTLENLVHRIADKYGDLPPDSPEHPIPELPYGVPLALRICKELQRRHVENNEATTVN